MADVSRVENVLRTFSPLVTYRSSDLEYYAGPWTEGDYEVRQRLLGFIPLHKQRIKLRFENIRDTPGNRLYRVRDDGLGPFLVWIHTITIRDTDDGRTKFSDDIIALASHFSNIYIFALILFKYRQLRLRRMIKKAVAAGAQPMPEPDCGDVFLETAANEKDIDDLCALLEKQGMRKR